MARAVPSKPVEIKATLKWDDKARHWIASGSATSASGVKRLVAPGASTTKALHRLTVLFEETHEGAFELVPDVHVPAAFHEEFNSFVKRLKVWKSEGAWIAKKRIELAIAFVKDHNMPARIVAPMLGMSPARLGRLITDYEMGVAPSRGVGRPPKEKSEEDDFDDE